MVSMVIREVRVKCFCLFIRTSFPPGRSSHVYRKILAESLERLNSTEGWNLNLQVSKSKKLKNKKKLYVRVRAFGAAKWSKIKKVKIK